MIDPVASRAWRNPLLLAILLLTTVAAYWPSLHGGFVFDDFPNIVDNRDVHITSLDWESLRQAALASPVKILKRPLAMASFGLDHYFSGGPDPFRMKVENLVIHLLNGLLLFGLLRAITRAPRSACARGETIALFVTAAWLLAPINFTAVAYVVQRMESLCHVFVFAGLWGYVSTRQKMLRDSGGILLGALWLIAGTALGALSKESALLLPLYAAIAEWCLFDFRTAGEHRDRRVLGLHGLLLGLPLLVIGDHAVRALMLPSAYAIRDFSMTERLLTEARILVHYLQWTLLPQPRQLGMYHDDIVLSQGLLSPVSTLASIVFLLGLVATAVAMHTRRPLFALGVLWFLSAHLITGTVIPLELVFEHRNYFASAGAFLAFFSLVLPRGNQSIAVARTSGCAALLVLYGGLTVARSLEWKDPIEFALSLTQKNPRSPRAAYELGRTYVVLSGYKPDSPLLPLADQALEHAAALPDANTLAEQARIQLDARTGRKTPDEVWQRMQKKLAQRAVSVSDVAAVAALVSCDLEGNCALPPEQMVSTFLAALGHEPPSVDILGVYANYAQNRLGDTALALRLTRQAVQLAPGDVRARRNLLVMLIASGKVDEARTEYALARPLFPELERNPAFAGLRN